MSGLRSSRGAGFGALLPGKARIMHRDAARQLLAALNAAYGEGAAALSLCQALCGTREGGAVTWRMHIAVDLVLPDTPMEMPDAEASPGS